MILSFIEHSMPDRSVDCSALADDLEFAKRHRTVRFHDKEQPLLGDVKRGDLVVARLDLEHFLDQGGTLPNDVSHLMTLMAVGDASEPYIFLRTEEGTASEIMSPDHWRELTRASGLQAMGTVQFMVTAQRLERGTGPWQMANHGDPENGYTSVERCVQPARGLVMPIAVGKIHRANHAHVLVTMGSSGIVGVSHLNGGVNTNRLSVWKVPRGASGLRYTQ